MSVRLVLGEPYWRGLGAREREVELAVEPGVGVSLDELLRRAGAGALVAEFTAGGETAPTLLVNGRVVPPGELGSLRLRDGDHVVIQMMLAGG